MEALFAPLRAREDSAQSVYSFLSRVKSGRLTGRLSCSNQAQEKARHILQGLHAQHQPVEVTDGASSITGSQAHGELACTPNQRPKRPPQKCRSLPGAPWPRSAERKCELPAPTNKELPHTATPSALSPSASSGLPLLPSSRLIPKRPTQLPKQSSSAANNGPLLELVCSSDDDDHHHDAELLAFVSLGRVERPSSRLGHRSGYLDAELELPFQPQGIQVGAPALHEPLQPPAMIGQPSRRRLSWALPEQDRREADGSTAMSCFQWSAHSAMRHSQQAAGAADLAHADGLQASSFTQAVPARAPSARRSSHTHVLQTASSLQGSIHSAASSRSLSSLTSFSSSRLSLDAREQSQQRSHGPVRKAASQGFLAPAAQPWRRRSLCFPSSAEASQWQNLLDGKDDLSEPMPSGCPTPAAPLPANSAPLPTP